MAVIHRAEVHLIALTDHKGRDVAVDVAQVATEFQQVATTTARAEQLVVVTSLLFLIGWVT